MEQHYQHIYILGDEPPDWCDEEDEDELKAKERRRQEKNAESRARKA